MNEIVSQRDRRLAAVSIAGLVLLLMLPNMLWLYSGYSDPNPWSNSAVMPSLVNLWVYAVIVPTILLLVLFALLGDVLWLACLLLAPFALLAPLEAFYVASYHHPTSAEILASTFATNPREIHEYLGNALISLSLCVLVGLVIALLAAQWAWRAQLRWRHGSRVWILALGLVTPLMLIMVAAVESDGDASVRLRKGVQMVESLADPIPYGFPFGVLQRFAQYHREWADMRADAKLMDAFRFQAHRTTDVHRRQVYVLVIGEASRRDHWQLFGYGRATNPELTGMPNLVPFPDMLSSWPESITAIPMLLTRKPPELKSLAWNEASILRAMKEAGYDTWWISNQMPIGSSNSPVSKYAFEAMHVEFLNHTSFIAPGSFDEDLLQPLRDAVHDSGHDLFIVLHLMGSHQIYDFRYPEPFHHFRPTVRDPVDGVSVVDRVRNSYDNSILYTDHVLSSVIGILRDSGAMSALWYASDHGESLTTPTCTLEGHGNGTRFEYEISALFWASDSYIAAFPQRMATLRANAQKRTLSADTFESLIDMTNTTYPGRNASQSLFDPQWSYRPRFVNGFRQVDWDHAEFNRNCQLVLPPNAPTSK